MKIKVGSLFDGIGGAPLSAVLSGAEPVWASEIEKIPISITKRHFPNMKHYGDITQINGAEIEPVDIIVGGSPCQDLSVAGKRAGLAGERSGLFMDQVRIVKEMRNATSKQTGNGSDKLPRPRYMVWENVPGAFSSNKGEDFRAVLEEICRVKDETVIIPGSPKGKWSTAGAIMGNGYSIAWRIVDAQYWGVPQRRRRIYLVADFGGHTAPEICFERESVSRDITEGGETGQRIAADAERSSGSSGESCVKSAGFIGANGVKAHGIGYEEEKSPTVVAGRTNEVVIESYGFEPGIAKREGNPNRFSEDLCPTLRAKMGDNQAAVAYSLQGNMIGRADHNGPQGSGVNEDVSFTLNTVDRHAVCYGLVSKGNGEAFLMEEKHMSLSCGGGQAGQGYPAILERRTDDAVCYNGESRVTGPHEVCPTVTRRWGTGGNNVPLIRTGFTPTQFGQYAEGCGTLRSSGGDLGGGSETLIQQRHTVRRLTPLECERLQGYPDGWTALDHEDKAVSNTQRYKALGNSFAVPNALFFISRCVKQLQKE